MLVDFICNVLCVIVVTVFFCKVYKLFVGLRNEIFDLFSLENKNNQSADKSKP